MNVLSRRELALEGIANLKVASEIGQRLKCAGSTQEVRDLAKAIHFLSFGAQQVGLALADKGRVNDLPL